MTMVSETKKSAPEHAPAPVKAAPKLAPASESGDAAVHILLAQRGGYAANGMDAEVAEVDRKLAELGLTAT